MPTFDPSTALIVVDIQNDFAHPDGSLYVNGAARVVTSANSAIDAASSAGALVIYTQDWHPPATPHFEKDGGIWPVHCVANTWGAEFHDDLMTVPGPVVRKGAEGNDGYSGFTTRDPVTGTAEPTDLEDMLLQAGVEQCVVVGLATDYCVKETVLDACQLGFEVLVPLDAVAAVNLSPRDGAEAIDAMVVAGAVIER